ncbi:MAG: riboflavin synthase [Succinivibrionaceae bacterium]
MFTGIVESIGKLRKLTPNGNGFTVEILAPEMDFSDVKIGDSIACNGVCLTVILIKGNIFEANISHETVNCTTFKVLEIGSLLNLEKALTPNKHLGGHIVQGHVDGVGVIKSINHSADAIDIWITSPNDIAHYIARKGSITVDGISLTVNEVNNNDFRLTLIPHTTSVTISEQWKVLDKVNIEVDVLARYIERLLGYQQEMKGSCDNKSTLSMQTLIENGFY